jgi:hypothetical protein
MGKVLLIISAVILYFFIVLTLCLKTKELLAFCGGGIFINDTIKLEETIFQNVSKV